MDFKNESLYGLFIKHNGEYFDEETKKLLDSEYIERVKDKFLRIPHRNKYFNLKLIYTLCGYYERAVIDGDYFRSEILVLQVVSSVFIGFIYLNEEEIVDILKLEYDYRLYDRNYNYYVRLKTNKIEPSS